MPLNYSLTTNSTDSFDSPFLHLHQIIQGSATLITSDRTHRLTSDGFILIHPHVPHKINMKNSLRVTIQLPIPMTKNDLPLFEEAFTPRDFNVDAEISTLLTSQQEPPSQAFEPLFEALTTAKNASNQNYFLSPRSPAKKHQMNSARELILNNLKYKINISDIAKVIGYSPFHFHRLFTSYHQITPGNYIIQERIRRACRLITLQDSKISTVANQSGFTSPTSFTKAFRTITGFSPSEYQQRVTPYRQLLKIYQ